MWTITLAVMGICLTGATVGAMLPLAIKAARRRPRPSCPAPLIATLSDVLGIFIFFSIVRVFF